MKNIDTLFPLKSTFKNVTFYFDKSLEKSVLSDLKNFLENKICNLKDFIQFDSDKAVNIYLFSDIDSFFINYLEEEIQKNVVISSHGNNIYTVNPKKILDRDYNIALGVIASTCIRILLNDEFNIKLPRWFKEGIVKYFGNKTGRCGLLYNKFNKINIETIKSIIIEDSNAVYSNFKGYFFAELVIEFLIEKYSKNIIKNIVNNSENSIFKTLGIESEELCQNIYDYIFSEKYLIPNFLNLSKKSEHFTYYYCNLINEKTLNDIINKLENNYDYVCDIVNLSISEKEKLNTNVYIYDSINDFHYDLYNKKCDDWFTGVEIIDTICIVDPNKTLPRHDYNSQLDAVIHEFIHVVTLRDHVMRAPWLKEGVALFFANPAPIDIIKKKYLENPLNDKDLYILFGDDYRMFQVGGGYIYSHTIIGYIIKTYSLNVLKVILTNPQKSPFEILEIDKKDFCYNWLEFFKKEYI